MRFLWTGLSTFFSDRRFIYKTSRRSSYSLSLSILLRNFCAWDLI